MFDVAKTFDYRELVDEDGIKVARLRLIEQAGLLHRIDDRDLESELLDRFRDAGIVVKSVDEEDASTGMRDEGLLSNLVEVPFADPTASRTQG